ncbi:MAG: PAS domain S-box protein [Nitrospira sp.]|nr:PAS domain S-box protein [Nitrospira sp.]
MHPLLARQLKRLGLDEGHPPSPVVWEELLKRIDRSYLEADQGHALLERSLALSSSEMQELYAQLKQNSETQLEQERNTLQTVLQSLGDGLCVVDAEWKIQMVNPQAELLFGETSHTLMGRSVYRMISPGPEEYRSECLITDSTFPSLASGEPYRTDDGVLLTRNGELVPIALVVSPLLLTGKAIGAVLVLRDISHQKRVEQERQQTEGLLRRIKTGLSELAESPEIYNGNLEQAFQTITRVAAVFLCVERVSIWFFTENRSTLQCAKLYQFTTQEYSQGTVLAATTYPRYFRELETEQPVVADDAQHDLKTAEFTASYLAPLGITSMLDVPIRSGGQMVGVICYEHIGPIRCWTLEEQHFAVSVANTLTLALEAADRKKVEQALRTSEGRLTMTVQSTNIGIWDWDLSSNDVYLSPEWKRQLGYEDHEFANSFQEWECRVHPDDHERALGAIEAYLNGRVGALENEHRLRHKDGSYRWILARGTIIRNEGALSSRMVGIHIDVTDRKAAEEVLHQAKDAAEAASRAKSQFLANMSHEIRTPMNGVLGLAELLLRYPLNEKERQLTQSIHRSGSVLLAIINDILDFSKIEAGKLQLEAIPFEVRRTFEESLAVSSSTAEQKGLRLSCRIDPHIPSALIGDPTRLRQIIVNLVSNAVKFTEQGTVTVSAEWIGTREGQPGLSVSVADTGIGIPLEAQSNIFDAFSQADGSTTRKYGGTGLGLAIVKQLVTLMGGTIELQSRPGEGTCFRFTVYCTPAAMPTQRPPELFAVPAKRGDTVSDQRPLRTGEVRILLVEDNPVNREVACGMLEVLNCRIDTAENGREALEAIAKTDYALVFMDCQMPEMDGLTATKLIRAREAAEAVSSSEFQVSSPRPVHPSLQPETQHAKPDIPRRVPIVALTAHAMQGDREQCLSVGMDDHLSKPFTLVQLEHMLARWLPNWLGSNAGQQAISSGSVGKETVGDLQEDHRRVSEPGGPSAGSIIDQTALAGIRALQRSGQPDIVVRVVTSYLDTSPDIVERIRSAARSQNATELRAAAHRLKSSSAQLGAMAVSADCRELEQMGERQDLTHVDEVIARLGQHYVAACDALRGEVSKGKAAA